MKEKWITPIGDEEIYQIDTAKWRTYKPVIDYSRCTGCAICAGYCPVSSVKSMNGDDSKIYIDLSYCKGCGICAEECPRKAILMVREGEEI